MTAGTTVLCFATKGAGSNDERRIVHLLADHDPVVLPFDRAHKAANIWRLLRAIRRDRPALVVMEGTGLAGGLTVLLARVALSTRFVVSSGDAVGPFLGSARPLLTVPGWIYEWMLYRASAGFIGWTPYLLGRAMTMGAPGGVTAAGYALHPELTRSGASVRAGLGISPDATVVGIVGSLAWTASKGYCYGWELVQAVRRVQREDVVALIVGGGDGLPRLRAAAGDDLGRRIFLPGPVAHREVLSYLAAMDVGSLPQSRDQVGSFRYTTKISEYHAARLPFVTGALPLAYDLADRWSWRLPGDAPWEERYISALASFLEGLSHEVVDTRRAAVPATVDVFDAADQRRRVGAFIADVLAMSGGDQRRPGE